MQPLIEMWAKQRGTGRDSPTPLFSWTPFCSQTQPQADLGKDPGGDSLCGVSSLRHRIQTKAESEFGCRSKCKISSTVVKGIIPHSSIRLKNIYFIRGKWFLKSSPCVEDSCNSAWWMLRTAAHLAAAFWETRVHSTVHNCARDQLPYLSLVFFFFFSWPIPFIYILHCPAVLFLIYIFQFYYKYVFVFVIWNEVRLKQTNR